jgi:hypothetical protein
MNQMKETILNKVCYTDLVYGRINKKLNSSYSNQEIEHLITTILKATAPRDFKKKGKNIYVYHRPRNIRLTINSNTNRVITVDRCSDLGFNVLPN